MYFFEIIGIFLTWSIVVKIEYLFGKPSLKKCNIFYIKLDPEDATKTDLNHPLQM